MDQDDSSSMISSAKTNIIIGGSNTLAATTVETSGSNNTNYAVHQNVQRNYYFKRARHDHHQNHHHNHHDYVDQTANICDISDNNNNIMNIGSPSAKFKGVVPQQNGHWGAQIYANHQRIWLGTFKSEKAAAMAYDSAAIRLRNGDTHRNFPWTNLTLHEPDFQSHYTMEAILNMIKDGSYQSKFEEFLRNQSQKKEVVEINSVSTTRHHQDHDHHLHPHHHHFNQQIRVHGDAQFLCRQLFQKELTPSDVGKLNRLVIPKKYAVKYFPYISELDNNNNTNNNPNSNITNNSNNSCNNTTNNSNIVETTTESGVEDIELVFYDKLMRSWRFRYCYWRSSQSFVFTRGWNRFVKENNLKANDVITFYTCHKCNVHGIRDENGQIFCLIDVTHNGVIESQRCLNNSTNSNIELMKVDLDLDLDLDLDHHHHPDDKFDHEPIAITTTHHEFKYKEAEASSSVEGKKFRLFGVDIK